MNGAAAARVPICAGLAHAESAADVRRTVGGESAQITPASDALKTRYIIDVVAFIRRRGDIHHA